MGREGSIPFLVARGLRREDAARYLGLSPTKFLRMVEDGRLPKPKRIDGCVIWDSRLLEAAWDDLGMDDAGAVAQDEADDPYLAGVRNAGKHA